MNLIGVDKGCHDACRKLASYLRQNDLYEFRNNKIGMIKKLRELAGYTMRPGAVAETCNIGLKDAKDAVEIAFANYL